MKQGSRDLSSEALYGQTLQAGGEEEQALKLGDTPNASNYSSSKPQTKIPLHLLQVQPVFHSAFVKLSIKLSQEESTTLCTVSLNAIDFSYPPWILSTFISAQKKRCTALTRRGPSRPYISQPTDMLHTQAF